MVFPEPSDARIERDGVWLLTLEKLVELKLASGLSAPHRALRDLGDVQRVIEDLGLASELAERLDLSVRAEYRRLWTIVREAPSGEGR